MTDMGREWLSIFEAWGAGVPLTTLFRLFGWKDEKKSRDQLNKWRQDPRFKAREAEIRERWPPEEVSPPVAFTWKLDRWLQAFQEHKDRDRACEESGITPLRVQHALAECPPFRRIFEFIVQAAVLDPTESAYWQKALAGDKTAARHLLTAKHPDYANRVEVSGEIKHTVSDRLMDQERKSLQSAFERHQLGEAIDVAVEEVS